MPSAFSPPPAQNSPAEVMPPLWLVFWAALLSLTWLLPPHTPPWSTFPADTWMAIMVLVGAAALLIRGSGPLSWHGLPAMVGLFVLLPWLQFGTGLLPYVGQAWVSSAYLLGFLLALLVGANWAQSNPNQLAHGLFLAIGTAAVLSVGLQLYAWLGMAEDGPLGFWAMSQIRSRPSANLGQPNQLATLLIWGLLACLWAYTKKLLGGSVILLVASFLLLGLAMTQSRAGLLALTCILVSIWLWKRLWHSRWVPLAATALYLLFFTIAPLLHWLDGVLLLGQESLGVRLIEQGEVRMRAWQLFAHAVFERPWFGYGWSVLSKAQLMVAESFPSLGSIFNHSHNLFLDLFLWCGLPLGLLIVACLLLWFWFSVRSVNQAEEAVLLLLPGAIAIHALVEFPLHYAYFLIPTGLVMGILNTRLNLRAIWVTPRWSFTCLLLTASFVVGITIRDYVEVADSYGKLRLEQSILGIGRGPMGEPPKVLALTQLREWISLARLKPQAGMSPLVLDELETMAIAIPSPPLAYQTAKAMALNGHPEKARVWLTRICKLTHEQECSQFKNSWMLMSSKNPQIPVVLWPEQ